MTEYVKKLITERRTSATPLTPLQEAKAACGVQLYLVAELVIFDFEPQPPQEKEDFTAEEKRILSLCIAGARAETYVSLMRWLNALIRREKNGAKVSEEETVAVWHRIFDWIVSEGILPPISHWNGLRTVTLPFESVHARVMGAYRDVRAFREQIKLQTRKGK